MTLWYLLYSIHAAQLFDSFLDRAPVKIEGMKALDLEAIPSVLSLRGALSSTRSSFANPFATPADAVHLHGRASGGVTLLPPATLPVGRWTLEDGKWKLVQ
jgi:hypothetical protein